MKQPRRNKKGEKKLWDEKKLCLLLTGTAGNYAKHMESLFGAIPTQIHPGVERKACSRARQQWRNENIKNRNTN